MTPAQSDLIAHLPGEKLIRRGLKDYANGKKTIHSCPIRIAGPRLVRAGLIEQRPSPDVDAEHYLYYLLGETPADPYPRYNSLLRELVSFERALDHRLPRPKPTSSATSECQPPP